MTAPAASAGRRWLGTALSLLVGCAVVCVATLVRDGSGSLQPFIVNLIVFLATSLLAAGVGAGWVSTRKASTPGALHTAANWGILVGAAISALTILRGR